MAAHNWIGFLVFISMTAVSSAGAYQECITPYGDYCLDYNSYGAGKDGIIPHQDAVKAMGRYYGHKGYRIGSMTYRGRFIEADIFKQDKQVDKVIFDRKTGRLRSIY